MGFWTIESLDICALGLVVDKTNPDSAGYTPPDFTQGIYEYNKGNCMKETLIV